MGEKTKSDASLPVFLVGTMIGTMIGTMGAGIVAGPGGMLLFLGIAIMAVATVASFQEPK